jgi:hypothetical protein
MMSTRGWDEGQDDRIVKTLARVGGWLAPYRGRMTLAMVLTTLACVFNLPVPTRLALLSRTGHGRA